MGKDYISIGIANEGIKNLELDIVKGWKPTNISRSKDAVYFKAEGKFYSMKREDYFKVFGS